LKTGPVHVEQFDADRLNDTLLNAGSITIDNALMTVFRDKRPPFKEGVIKYLPATFLKKIPVHFSVDTTRVKNADIEYTELNENTNRTGTITFNRMNAMIAAIKSHPGSPADSLLIEAEAWLMDSVKLGLQIKESYSDSLAGFRLIGSISPANGQVLNPVLIPLASIKLESGFLDTLTMHVSGTEYHAMGEMQMFYHDLKIKFLNNKDEKTKNFISFLANLFVIKNNNRARTGAISWERARDKSSLNYLVKILLNGIISSIGIRNNKNPIVK
jgi:hypothetical protein